MLKNAETILGGGLIREGVFLRRGLFEDLR